MSPDGPRSSVPAADGPATAILDLLDTSGQLPERTILAETPYSTEACQRTLDALAFRGVVVRRNTGVETVVCLADGQPATSALDG